MKTQHLQVGISENWRQAWCLGGRGNEGGGDTGHCVGKQGARAGGFILRVAIIGLHCTSSLDALAFSLLSFQLSCCLLVHYSMINQAISAQDFYSVNRESLSSTSSCPTPCKN